MNGFPVGHFATGLAVSAAVVVLLMLLTWVVALRIGRFAVVDVVWGLGFAVLALASLAWSAGSGDDVRRYLVAALTTVWGVRLAIHIGLRSRGTGEDPRYTELLERSSLPPALYALVFVFLTQAVVLWFVSLPVQVAMYEPAAVNAFAWLGTAVWAVGFTFEAVGDRQLQRFRDDPASAGRVMDRGLWRYTRHPNYFGDACVWWGLWLIAAQTLPGALTILSPAAMTFTLARGTGKPLLERHMRERRPGYAEYVERTSGFLPWPPKRTGPAA